MDADRGHEQPVAQQAEAHPGGALTRVLADLRHGDIEARARLAALVYDELRQAAAMHLRGERSGHTLQPTALVHEAFLRLFGNVGAGWENRAHFFGAAAEAMRRILVDYARRRKAVKRGGGAEPGVLTDVGTNHDRAARILDVDAALARLAAEDDRKRKLVELRFFAGLTLEDAARTLDISLRTAKRDWAYAKAWLYRELSEGNGQGPPELTPKAERPTSSAERDA